jgi:pSer/pThr/pTyr-binding forkhead associated (FHA) protein/tetratricopeptide (TPR) repeat protein
MSARAVLTILRNGQTLKAQPLEGEAVLGRADGCVIRLDDRAISRQHAVFRTTPEGVQVEKKSEFAPLAVNGAECTKAMLREGDVISIGPYLMRVSIPAAKAAEPPAPEPAPPPAPQGTVGESALLPPLDAGGSAPTEVAPAEAPPADAAAAPDAGQGGDAGLPVEGAPADVAPAVEGLAGLEGAGADAQAQADAAAAAVPVEATSADLGPVDEEAKTRIVSSAKVNVRLVFTPGTANVTDYELTKDEISIGRGKNCDIVLNDKKSSRKHAIIRRSGLQVVIHDLGSANGTLVNGVKIKEHTLAGDDVVTVGDVEFRFVATSADYEAKQADFMPVPPEEPEPVPEMEALAPPADGTLDPGVPALMPGADAQALMAAGQAGGLDLAGAGAAAGTAGGAADLAGVPGITGIPGARPTGGSLVEKFKALPRRKQIIYAAVALTFVAWFLEEDVAPKKAPSKKPVAQAPTAPSGPPTFDTLTAEQKKFVETQHELAFRHFTNRDYDQSLFEVRRIFALIDNYKDAREIERYALEGKRKLEAIQEEKRKKEEEERLKARIAQLVDEARALMVKKDYPKAQDKFGEILAIDPDNAAIAGWKKEIEEFEEQKRLAEQAKQVQEEINKRAWELYEEALAIKKQGRCHEAIDAFGKVADVGSSDKRPIAKAQAGIKACRAYIRNRREPLLAEARRLEEAGEFSKAFQAFKKATRVDPPHPAGYAGMSRIRGILHERSKVVYTEGVLAESYSDFATAKKKFQECLDMSPEDSIYFQRAQRKLSHYFGRKEGDAPQ